MVTGNNQPGRMVVGQTFTIGKPSELLNKFFLLDDLHYSNVCVFFITQVFKGMSGGWKSPPKSAALGDVFCVKSNAD